MSSPIETATAWAEDHKPAAVAIALAAVGGLFFLARSRRAANGTTGALAAGVGSASLVPYGDATSLGFTGLTDATQQGFQAVNDSLQGITGLLSSVPIPDAPAVTGGTETGNTIPTPGGAGVGAGTGQTATPAFAPTPVPTPALAPTNVAPPTYVPPATFTPNGPPATPPGTGPTPTNVQPTYNGNTVSADIFTGSQPGAVLGVPPNARYLGSYDEKSAQILLHGGVVKNGGITPYRLVPGANYAVPV